MGRTKETGPGLLRPSGYEEQLTEEELIQRMDAAWDQCRRLAKFQYKREQERVEFEVVGAWEPAAEYFEALVNIDKAILNIKIAVRLTTLSAEERKKEEQRLVADCDRRYSAGKLYYYDSALSRTEELRIVSETRTAMKGKIKSYCRAVRVFGVTEDSEFWPEKLYPSKSGRCFPADVIRSVELPAERTVQSTCDIKELDRLGRLSDYQRSIASVLFRIGMHANRMQVAQEIKLTNPFLPAGFRTKIDESITSFDQLLRRYPVLLKRFGNEVSAVRKILKGRGL